jgi:hypothetical protein
MGKRTPKIGIKKREGERESIFEAWKMSKRILKARLTRRGLKKIPNFI